MHERLQAMECPPHEPSAAELEDYDYATPHVTCMDYAEVDLDAMSLGYLRRVVRSFGLDPVGKDAQDLIDELMAAGREDEAGEGMFFMDPDIPGAFGACCACVVLLRRRSW